MFKKPELGFKQLNLTINENKKGRNCTLKGTTLIKGSEHQGKF
jgi:hypothetical protein